MCIRLVISMTYKDIQMWLDQFLSVKTGEWGITILKVIVIGFEYGYMMLCMNEADWNMKCTCGYDISSKNRLF